MYDLDNHKLAYHPKPVTHLLDGLWPITPITVEIGLTSACNQRCAFCAYDWNKKRYDIELKPIKYLCAHERYEPQAVVLSGDGEPTLHPGFTTICDILETTGIKLGLMTNGTWGGLKDRLDHFSWVRFSINAGTRERYEQLHGTDDFDLVLHNLEECCKNRGDTTIGVQCLMLEPKYSDYMQLAQHCYDRKVDYLVYKPYSKHPSSINEINPDYSTWNMNLMPHWNWTHVRRRAIRQTMIPKQYDHCLAAPLFALVTADAKVWPCAQFVGDREWCMGDLSIQSWEAIVGSQRRKKMMEDMRVCDVSICRKPCRLDPANSYLYRLKNPESHDYFL